MANIDVDVVVIAFRFIRLSSVNFYHKRHHFEGIIIVTVRISCAIHNHEHKHEFDKMKMKNLRTNNKTTSTTQMIDADASIRSSEIDLLCQIFARNLWETFLLFTFTCIHGGFFFLFLLFLVVGFHLDIFPFCFSASNRNIFKLWLSIKVKTAGKKETNKLLYETDFFHNGWNCESSLGSKMEFNSLPANFHWISRRHCGMFVCSLVYVFSIRMFYWLIVVLILFEYTLLHFTMSDMSRSQEKTTTNYINDNSSSHSHIVFKQKKK